MSFGVIWAARSQDIYDDDGSGGGDGDPVAQPKSETEAETAVETAAATATTTPAFAALSPVKIVARGDVKIGYFDVSRFIKSVGPFAKVR